MKNDRFSIKAAALEALARMQEASMASAVEVMSRGLDGRQLIRAVQGVEASQRLKLLESIAQAQASLASLATHRPLLATLAGEAFALAADVSCGTTPRNLSQRAAEAEVAAQDEDECDLARQIGVLAVELAEEKVARAELAAELGEVKATLAATLAQVEALGVRVARLASKLNHTAEFREAEVARAARIVLPDIAAGVQFSGVKWDGETFFKDHAKVRDVAQLIIDEDLLDDPPSLETVTDYLSKLLKAGGCKIGRGRGRAGSPGVDGLRAWMMKGRAAPDEMRQRLAIVSPLLARRA